MSPADDVSDRRIVVGVDGSSASRVALRRAVQISAQTGLRVDAIYAWQVPRSMGWQVHAWRLAPDRDAATVLAGIVEEVLGNNKPPGLRLLAEQGSATRVLLEHSRTAALLVVGSRGLGGFAGLLLGSVSRHCAEGSACPVLVIHDRMPDVATGDLAASIHQVVVGVDGSAPSELGLRWAERIASITGARVDAVTAWEFPTTIAPVFSKDWRPDRDAELALTTAVGNVFGDARPENLHLQVVEGNATRVLIERSEGADLLVVGSRGQGGFAELLLGSVSAACAEHAHCPVLVVHGGRAPDNDEGAQASNLAETPS